MPTDVERGGASSVTKFENGSWIDAEPRPAVPSRGLDRLSLSCSRCMRNPAIVQGASWHFAPTWLGPRARSWGGTTDVRVPRDHDSPARRVPDGNR